jgi:2-methylcitrate dehydratase PrpD
MAREIEGIGRRNVLNRVALAGVAGLVLPLIAPGAARGAETCAPERSRHLFGYTPKLAAYAAAFRYEDIPPDVLARAKDCIADTAAVILFGGTLPWSKMIVAYAQANSGPGKCAILGSGPARVHGPAAALAHGAMTHAFELDSLTDPDTGAHPGATLFTAGLAVAQERGLSGRELLTAFVAGAETMFRIGLATKHTNEERGFHAPGTTGPFGAGITAGKLMGLGAEKLTNVLGIAGSCSAGLLEFAHAGNGAMVKRLHLGRAAESGVLAASLAEKGFTGPTTVLEGDAGYLHDFCIDWDVDLLTRGLGDEFLSRTILIKRFACHITAHNAVEAMLDLMREKKFSGDEVSAIAIAGSKRMATVNNIANPADILIAQFSIPFSVALSLYRNPIDPVSFDEAAVHDPKIRGAMKKITITAAEGQPNNSTAADVRVTLNDGRVFERRVTEFTGNPRKPFDRAGLEEKFLLLTKAFPRANMERMFDRLQNLENEKTLDWVVA